MKAIYKTVWEISQKTIIDLSADRGAFIDQSQSLNIHLATPTMAQLTSMHFYGWKKGLKTGMVSFRRGERPELMRCSTTSVPALQLVRSSSLSTRPPSVRPSLSSRIPY